jgi:hypothetical protein
MKNIITQLLLIWMQAWFEFDGCADPELRGRMSDTHQGVRHFRPEAHGAIPRAAVSSV